MEGKELLVAISRTKHHIKLLLGSEHVMITVDQAAALVGQAEYVGSGNKHRIRSLRLAPPKLIGLPWVECWRTTGASVLPPAPGFFA